MYTQYLPPRQLRKHGGDPALTPRTRLHGGLANCSLAAPRSFTYGLTAAHLPIAWLRSAFGLSPGLSSGL